MSDVHEPATAPADTPEVRPEDNKKAWGTAGALGLLIALLVSVFATMFMWPMATTDPKNIELGLVAPEHAKTQITEQLESRNAELFTIQEFSSPAAAEQAVNEREVTGALVIDEEGSKQMLTASAGNAQVTQMLTQMAATMSDQGQTRAAELERQLESAQAAGDEVDPARIAQVEAVSQNAEVEVVDLVSSESASAINMTVLPVLIGGIAGSALATFMVKKPHRRFLTLAVGAASVGLSAAAILGPWFGVLEGGYWLNSLAIAVGVLSVSACVTGLAALFGSAGIGIGVLVFMLFGNPWGGVMVPTEFLATPWGTLGAYMPNGTIINLLKDLSLFPAAATGGYWWTLSIWAAIGLVLLGLGVVMDKAKEATKVGRAVAEC